MNAISCKNCRRHVTTVLGYCPCCGTRLRTTDPRPLLLALVAVLMAWFINSQSMI